MDLTFTDVNRALYDARTVGPSNREHPLQCSLHNLATMGRECDSKVQDALDRQFSTFVGEIQPGSFGEEEASLSAGYSADCVASLVRAAMVNERSKESKKARLYPNAMTEGLDFANEISLLSSSIPAPVSAPAQAPVPIPAHVTAPGQVYSMQTKNDAATLQAAHGGLRQDRGSGPENNANGGGRDGGIGRVTDLTSKPGTGGSGRGDQTSKRPFTSGRDLFVQDGGKLPEASKKRERGIDGATEFVGKRTFGGSGGGSGNGQRSKAPGKDGGKDDDYELPPELEGLDKNLVQKIESEILQNGQNIKFGDIAGLKHAKSCVIETIVWPIQSPHLFTGMRSVPKGVLLFGPPGTGKTLVGKAIANEAGATFFAISASSLMSKWIGEGEKLVRVLFAVACYHEPAVVFLDEVDSLLTQRSSDENESSRRIKTEFLVQLDGAGSNQEARVVIVGATNRPEELDEAARRRFVKRLYIPLPDIDGRRELFRNLLGSDTRCVLTSEDAEQLVIKTKGFSGADIRSLCQDAAMGPMRELAISAGGNLQGLRPDDVPAMELRHFESALKTVKATVSPDELTRYLDWNRQYGSDQNVEEAT